ncbi:MAG: efflux RND transporter periplasmic adaptor subunit [Isosphaeraceae bacterium]|nr:efflux RND transporter periplasmic adaptor subunit [Isosphaeraceae bacterium]
MFWKVSLGAIAIAVVGGAVYFSGVTRAQVVNALHSANRQAHAAESHPTPAGWAPKLTPAWNGMITVEPAQRIAIGLRTAEVLAQTNPIRLELTGRTAYDDSTLIKIRSRFDTRVEDVYVKLGDRIKTGDRLLELYSNDLAQAKSDYQTKYVQWQHDVKLLTAREKLQKEGAISTQVLVDTQNDEQKSRLDFILAGDKLKVYKVPEEDVKPLLKGLSDRLTDATALTNVADKARMTMLSPADGFVIKRDVVKGNFYETSADLMTIAPLDHLWVWINVYELDQDKVHLNQTLEIQFPFLKENIKGRVEYVANEVDKDTRAVKVRATVPNPGVHLKADMLVKAQLDIPPVPGQTVIPRQAMVTFNGVNYAYIRRPRSAPATTEKDSDGPEDYERRKLEVAQENTDTVIVRSGLKPGEVVVTAGSLILSQIYEDSRMVDTGLPDT